MFLYEVVINFTEEYAQKISKEKKQENDREEDLDGQAEKKLLKETKSYNASCRDKTIFLSDVSDDCFDISVCKMDSPLAQGEIKEYVGRMPADCRDWHVREITIGELGHWFNMACRHHYMRDEEYPLRKMVPRKVARSFDRDELVEDIFEGKEMTEDQIRERSAGLASRSLTEEIKRILTAPVQQDYVGQPVHYLIETDDPDFEEMAVELLMQALYRKNRVISRRYTVVNTQDVSGNLEEDVYRISDLGCVLIKFQEETDTQNPYASADVQDVIRSAEAMRKYRNRTLTFFLLPRDCKKTKELLFRNAAGCTFVEISQDVLKGDEAKTWLRAEAEKRHAVPDDRLMGQVADAGKTYALSELNEILETWLSGYLKEAVYPVYSHLNCAAVEEEKKKPEGDAYQELQKMVGLGEAKQVIDEALDYFKAQKLYKEKGLQEDQPAMHMVFTGNPGTAKTTVARLFAQIMKDNGLLTEGKLYEVGRADLVGRYVGWTARQVKEAFQRAEGSVLFIDEAYSLVDDRDGSYGDEAINTIVQEMENHREDMVVILAGYPEPMERLLAKNPGLRSRIAYHVQFDDYSAEDLYQIARLQAQEKGMHLGPGVRAKLLPILKQARKAKDFGNGRYVRNLVEQAKRKQASRLVHMDYDEVTDKMATTLKACDFADLNTGTDLKETAIGF